VWSDDWATFNNHTYKFFYDRHADARDADVTSHGMTSHRDADVACHSLGAMLVSIGNEDEMKFIGQRVLRKRTLSGYIGGTRDETGQSL